MPIDSCAVEFEKWQALGNDYIIIDAARLPFELTPSRIVAICAPHTGVGSDGILLLSRTLHPGAVARMQIFNPDGSESNLSGNGAREAVMYLRSAGWADSDQFSIVTGAGEIHASVDTPTVCTVQMGTAALTSPEYPSGGADGMGEMIVAGRPARFRHVAVGNPQCTFEVADEEALDALDLGAIGPGIEHSDLFPHRTNVSWYVSIAPGTIRARIFERGVGETTASGTGATGAAVAYVLGGGSSPVRVLLEGGELDVVVGADLKSACEGGPNVCIRPSSPLNSWRSCMQPSRRLELVAPYLFAELERKIAAKKAAGIDVISLGIGDPDTPTYPPIVQAAQAAVADPSTHTYPTNRGRAEFREAVAGFYARRFGVSLDTESEVMPAIGAKECIFNLNLAFLDPGEVALASDPGYPVYTGGPLLACADPVVMPLVPELGFAPDFDAIPDEVLRRARLMFLNYPNNPTGAILPDGVFERAIAVAQEHDILVVHDNAYSETTYDGYVAPSFLATPGAREVGVEVFSLSKGYNMTGWRCAAIVGNAEAIGHYWRLKSTSTRGCLRLFSSRAPRRCRPRSTVTSPR